MSRIYSLEEDAGPARERAVSKTKITWLLFFTNPEDEALYLRSLKNLFNFRTFWPAIVVFVAFSLVQTEFTASISGEEDLFLRLTLCCSLLFLALLALFFLAQLVDELKERAFAVPRAVHRAARYVLRRLLWGRVEDVIVILSTLSQGLHQLSLVSRDLCVGNGDLSSVPCDDIDSGRGRGFPLGAAFFGYVSLLLLPVYFKSVDRHVTMGCWLTLSVFYAACFFYGDYALRGSVLLFFLFFFVSLYEAERYKMTSYLLSKEALSFEKNKLLIAQEKAKSIERKLHLALVHQILPRKVAEQIIAGQTVQPESFEQVTIFFSDVEGFTKICAAVSPIQVVRMLNELYTVMDYCTSLFPLYKVETIGDAYMVVGGLPERSDQHAVDVANFALLVARAVQAVKSPIDGSPIRIRIGLHSGPVMAGVVGNLMPRYCLFGDTVNTASRMESNGEAGRVHCSQDTAQLLQSMQQHVVESRGEIPIKGKGQMHTYWLTAATADNTASNDAALARVASTVEELLRVARRDHAVDDSARALHALGSDGDDFTASRERGRERDETKTHTRIDTIPEPQSGDGVTIFDIEQGSVSSPPPMKSGFFSRLSGYRPLSQSVEENSHNSKSAIVLSASGSAGNVKQAVSVKSIVVSPRQQQPPSQLSQKLSQTQTTGGVIARNLYRLAQSTQRTVRDVDLSGAKMLVVEDSDTQRKVLVQRLHVADPSWDVSYAVSGEDALQKLKAAKFQFDVVLVDENLSIHDGLFGHELVQVMRESFRMRDAVIVACTSQVEGAREDLLQSGVDEVWPKPPPSAQDVKRKLETLLVERINRCAQQQGLRAEIKNYINVRLS